MATARPCGARGEPCGDRLRRNERCCRVTLPGPGGRRTRPSPSLLKGQPEDPTSERKGTLAIHSHILPDQHPHLPRSGHGLAAKPGLLPHASRTLAGRPDSGSYRQVGQPLTPQLQPGRRATRVPDREAVAVDHHAEILGGRKWSRMTRALRRRTYDLFAGCPRLLSSRIAAAMRSCRSVAGWRTRGSPSIGSPRVLVAARAAASWISAYRAGAGRGRVRVSSSPRSWACATRAPMGCGRPALVTRASSP